MSGDFLGLAILIVTPALLVLGSLAGIGLVLAGLADPDAADGLLVRPRHEGRRP